MAVLVVLIMYVFHTPTSWYTYIALHTTNFSSFIQQSSYTSIVHKTCQFVSCAFD